MHFHLDVYIRVNNRSVHQSNGFRRIIGIVRYDEEVIRDMMDSIAREVEATQIVLRGESNIYYHEDGNTVSWRNAENKMIIMMVSECDEDCVP